MVHRGSEGDGRCSAQRVALSPAPSKESTRADLFLFPPSFPPDIPRWLRHPSPPPLPSSRPRAPPRPRRPTRRDPSAERARASRSCRPGRSRCRQRSSSTRTGPSSRSSPGLRRSSLADRPNLCVPSPLRERRMGRELIFCCQTQVANFRRDEYCMSLSPSATLVLPRAVPRVQRLISKHSLNPKGASDRFTSQPI